mgnify:CR=1 FL=1
MLFAIVPATFASMGISNPHCRKRTMAMFAYMRPSAPKATGPFADAGAKKPMNMHRIHVKQ